MIAYLDNSATTAAAPEVVEAMLPYFSSQYGNAQSVHSFGQAARAAVEAARRQIALLINAAPAEIVFTSGGTESDNSAIRGIAEASNKAGSHIITSAIEHPAVLATCKMLEEAGFDLTYLPVTSSGVLDTRSVREAVRDDTILVSVMHSNNEIGTIQPIAEIGAFIGEIRQSGRKTPYFHSDAVQSAGKVPIDVEQLGVDLLSLSSHKIHGPKGAGALYVKKGTRLAKLLHGGHHERDRRAGTENVAGIVGFGKAAELAIQNLRERAERMSSLRDAIERRLTRSTPGATVNGAGERLPNILNASFDGIDGESLLIALDLKGVAVSTGAACASGSLEPSHVLTALGLSRGAVRGSIRISLGAFTTREEVERALEILCETVHRLREMAPEDVRTQAMS
jgi:cysteine desulfurase